MDIPLEALLRPRSSALLVIDMQNDYIHPQGAIGRSGKDTSSMIAIVPPVQRLIASARARGVPVYFARNWSSPDTDSPAWKARAATKAHEPAGVAGSWGAGWYEVAPLPGEIVVNKYRYDAFLGTPLEMMLRAQGIETVICCGVATNVCVESTARSAYMRDFHLVLVGDCCASRDQRLHDATLENIRRSFGRVATGVEVESAWSNLVTQVR